MELCLSQRRSAARGRDATLRTTLSRRAFLSWIQPLSGLLPCVLFVTCIEPRLLKNDERFEREDSALSRKHSSRTNMSVIRLLVTVTGTSVVCCAVSSTLHHLNDLPRELRTIPRARERIPDGRAHILHFVGPRRGSR